MARNKDPFSKYTMLEQHVTKNPNLTTKAYYVYMDNIGIPKSCMASYLSQIKRKLKCQPTK